MKTIQKWEKQGHYFSGDPIRETDEKAEALIKKGEYRYVSKEMWKKNVRDAKKELDKS